MRILRLICWFSASLGLLACSGQSPNYSPSDAPNQQAQPSEPLNNNPSPTEPMVAVCAANDCGTLTRLLTIPDIENLYFTPDGRLFVSADRFYEVDKNLAGELALQIVDDGSCVADNTEFLGITQRGDVLYSHCNDNPPKMYATLLDDTPEMVAIHTLDGMGLPNGAATDHQDRIYIVDGPFTATPQIVRITMDPNDPFSVINQEVWLTDTLQFPNGLAFDGSDFYLTDSDATAGQQGLVKRVPLNPDGSPGTPEIIYVHDAVLDDLSVVDDDRLLVSDFTQGRILLLSKTGDVLASTDIQTFVAAADVQIVQPPLFETNEVLIADKGVLGERMSDNGNALLLLTPDP